MIKKTLTKSLVGTVAAGAMILPGAMTVAPQLELVKCMLKYKGTRPTSTDAQIQDPLVRPNEAVQVDVKVFAGDGDPTGDLIVTVTGPNGKRVRTKEKPVGDGNKQFQFGGFRLGKKKEKTYKVTARYIGNCKDKNSSGSAYFVVSR